MKTTRIPEIGAVVTVSIEVSRWSWIKRRPSGEIDFVSVLPCPYNYGSIVGTRGEDGDPLDAVVLGPRLGYGTRCVVAVRGLVNFVDAGDADPKLVCSVRTLEPADRAGVERFFVVYAAFKRLLYRLRNDRAGADTRSLGWDETR